MWPGPLAAQGGGQGETRKTIQNGEGVAGSGNTFQSAQDTMQNYSAVSSFLNT